MKKDRFGNIKPQNSFISFVKRQEREWYEKNNNGLYPYRYHIGNLK